MQNSEPQTNPENMFVLHPDEAYAGYSRFDWDQIVDHIEVLKPVELDNIDAIDQECAICHDSFGPSEDGITPEKPISLPCGHVFGKDCILHWVFRVGPHESDDNAFEDSDSSDEEHEVEEFDTPDEDLELEDIEDLITPDSAMSIQDFDSPEDRDSRDSLEDFDDLITPDSAMTIQDFDSSEHQDSFEDFEALIVPDSAMSIQKEFSCPICRKKAKTSKIGVDVPAIEARLRFWDAAYGTLGLVRSAEEEFYRQSLWRYVEEMRSDLYALSLDQRRTLEMRAQVAAISFALRRTRSDLRDTQVHLRDAFFNLGCYGLDDLKEEYCAENYEDRRLPDWCYRWYPIEYDYSVEMYCMLPQRMGPWRRRLFADILEEMGDG